VGGLQLDSINVVARAHYLTVWSRLGPFDRDRLDRLVYRRRALFEYWAHAACLVPAAHLAAWRRAMLDYRMRHTGWSGWLRRNRRVLDAVLDAIRSNGPMAAGDFAHRRPRGAASGWWNWKPAQHALHYLWMSGSLLVASRTHFQKRFDLAERVLPEALAGEALSSAAFREWHIERSLHAMGAATTPDLRLYLTFPRLERRAWQAALAGLLARGVVRQIAVAGDRGPWFALARDVPALLRAARRRRPSRGTTLLSPFDSLLWHRDRVKRLFGFDYRIEVYTPGHQRVHGYYTLPVLHDGQLIGRVDAKTHRDARRLEVRGVHLERWFAAGAPPPVAGGAPLVADEALAGLAGALASLAAFVGADRVTLGRVVPGRLRGPLARALRAAARGEAARPAGSPGPPVSTG
jgi:uncharacterized protein YcaQ